MAFHLSAVQGRSQMKRSYATILKVCSLVVAGAVLLCHVLGALCVMVPAPVMAEAVGIAPPPVQAPMAADHGCWQSIPSSAERLDNGASVPFTSRPVIIPAPAMPNWYGIGTSCQLWATGVPLHAFLSTFRI